MNAALTAQDVALRLRVDVRTARRRCAAWADAQHLPHVPRVATAHRPHRRGRPGYLVDAESLSAWLRGVAPSNTTH